MDMGCPGSWAQWGSPGTCTAGGRGIPANSSSKLLLTKPWVLSYLFCCNGVVHGCPIISLGYEVSSPLGTDTYQGWPQCLAGQGDVWGPWYQQGPVRPQLSPGPGHLGVPGPQGGQAAQRQLCMRVMDGEIIPNLCTRKRTNRNINRINNCIEEFILRFFFS